MTGSSASSYKCEPFSKSLCHKEILPFHMKTHTDQQTDKSCEGSEVEFINLNANDPIKIKSEFSEEGTIINYGDVYTERSSESADFELIQVKKEQCDVKTEPKSNINQDKIEQELDVARLSSGEIEFSEPTESQNNATGASNSTHKCEVSNKSFEVQSDVIKHMKLHTAEKSHKCDYCEKTFTQKRSLLTHISSHTGEKYFKCDVCEKKFSRKDYLHVHARLHTGEKPYKCEICEKRFTKKSNLSAHSLVHSGKKEFKCNICEKDFSQKHRLTSHIATHNKDKQYQCSICEKKYSHQATLTAHIRDLH